MRNTKRNQKKNSDVDEEGEEEEEQQQQACSSLKYMVYMFSSTPFPPNFNVALLDGWVNCHISSNIEIRGAGEQHYICLPEYLSQGWTPFSPKIFQMRARIFMEPARFVWTLVAPEHQLRLAVGAR